MENLSIGESNLNKLLTSMAPTVLPEEFVFCTIPDGKYGDYIDISPLASFSEAEGLTLVITKENAEILKLPYKSIFKGITLTIHSSLDAVGLTAAVSNILAKKNISANIIAGYYHDHIFVQIEKVDLAIKALNEFTKR